MIEDRSVRHADLEDVRGPLWEEAVAAAARGALVPAGEAGDDLAEDGPADEESADGNLRRYARWQWRDFWRNRGGWLALGALLGVALLVALAQFEKSDVTTWRDATAAARAAAEASARVRGMAELFFTLGGAAAALIGVGGLVSRERERGLQRFLFAKPVRPARYYLQMLLVNSAGSLLIFAGAVLLAAGILGSVVPVASVLATGIAAYVLTAGVTFLLSTLVRFDAPIAALWLLAGFPVYGAAQLNLPGARVVSWLFPEGPALAIEGWVVGDPALHPSAGTYALARTLVLLVAVLYGLIAYAGGVAVLRRRAIST